MNHHATGSFDVRMEPQPAPASAPALPHQPAAADAPTLARLVLDKRYHGPLSATGAGQMLSALASTSGSAGYVAIESVAGTLHGRSGSFVLQHSGTMDRGTPQLSVSVVPDSGTGALAGLAGRLHIRIENGSHFYDFDYTLPD